MAHGCIASPCPLCAVDNVTVLPDAGRDEMVRRMIHGTNPKTGEPKRRDRSRVGQLIAKSNAAPLRRAQPKRRRFTRKP